MTTQTRKRKVSSRRSSSPVKRFKKPMKSIVAKTSPVKRFKKPMKSIVADTELDKPVGDRTSPNFDYVLNLATAKSLVKEEEEVDERGLIHSKLKQLVDMVGNLSSYTTKSVISVINSISSLTSKIPPISNFFCSLSKVLYLSSFAGKIGFQALFSLHPNVIAPILSLTISTALGYVLGSFVGSALWPSYEITDKLYSMLSLGTNISVTGISTAAIAAPIGGISLTRSIGNFLDVFQLQRSDDSTLLWLLKKMSWGMIGGLILMMSIYGFNPASIMTSMSQLTTLLPASPGPFATLYVLYNLGEVSRMLFTGDYKGALMKSVHHLFIRYLLGMLYQHSPITGTSHEGENIYEEPAAKEGLFKNSANSGVPSIAGEGVVVQDNPNIVYGTDINFLKLEDVPVETKGIVVTLFNKIANIELPDVFSWTNITGYLKSCIVGIQSILGSSVAGISTSWILGGMVCVLAVYSVWRRINNGKKKKKLEDEAGAVKCVEKFLTTIHLVKELTKQSIKSTNPNIKSDVDNIKDLAQSLRNIELDGRMECCKKVELGLSNLRTFVFENVYRQWNGGETIQTLMGIVREIAREVMSVIIGVEGNDYISLVQNTVETLRFEVEGALILSNIVTLDTNKTQVTNTEIPPQPPLNLQNKTQVTNTDIPPPPPLPPNLSAPPPPPPPPDLLLQNTSKEPSNLKPKVKPKENEKVEPAPQSGMSAIISEIKKGGIKLKKVRDEKEKVEPAPQSGMSAIISEIEKGGIKLKKVRDEKGNIIPRTTKDDEEAPKADKEAVEALRDNSTVMDILQIDMAKRREAIGQNNDEQNNDEQNNDE